MTTKRVRGLKAFLSDVTNAPSPPQKRHCKARASSIIADQLKSKAPRGIHSPQHSETTHHYLLRQLPDSTDSSHITLKQLLNNRPEILQQGLVCITQYIERNTIFAIQKACALQIFSGCVCRGTGLLEACDVAAACTTFSARTIRRWATDLFGGYFSFLSTIDDVTDERLELELVSGRGKHPKWESLMADENFRKEAREYVLENGYVKGKPNMTLLEFVSWLKEHKKVEVCTSTASLWLHDMGFTHKQFSKGVYFDGHERDDVIKDRKVYLETLASYSHTMWSSHSPAPNPACRPIIRVYHDESTFYANADQSFHWTDGSKQVLKQKSLGQAIMVSDFVEEVGGFLEFQGDKARLLLEHQTEGYFTNTMLISQVNKAISLFEKKYPVA